MRSTTELMLNLQGILEGEKNDMERQLPPCWVLCRSNTATFVFVMPETHDNASLWPINKKATALP